MGYLSLAGKIGAVAVTVIFIIIPHMPILFCFMAFASAYLISQLTETLGKEMNDIIPELAIKRKQSFLSTSNVVLRRHTVQHIRKMSLNKSLLCDSFFKIEK